MKATVALPVWNGKDIAWLALESLCRQEGVDFEWELLVFEEEHEGQLGSDFFHSYEDRLSEVGGVVNYITQKNKLSLGEKWATLARLADNTKMFAFCSADDYSHPNLLANGMREVDAGHDWVCIKEGYFFDIDLKKIISYVATGRLSGLNMITTTEKAQKIPFIPRNRVVDSWLYKNIRPTNLRKDLSLNWTRSLFTNGRNNISTQRRSYFETIRPPFKNTDISLHEIVPHDIAERLLAL